MAKEKAPVVSAAPAEDRKRAIEAAMGQIEKMYGKGSIMRLGDQNNLQVDVIPTGSLSLDVALGVGGLPRGRIVEIYGPESPVRLRWPFMWRQRPRKRAARWRLWTQSTHWTPPTHGPWA